MKTYNSFCHFMNYFYKKPLLVVAWLIHLCHYQHFCFHAYITALRPLVRGGDNHDCKKDVMHFMHYVSRERRDNMYVACKDSCHVSKK